MKYLALKLAAAMGLIGAYGLWRREHGRSPAESRRDFVNRCIDETEALSGTVGIGATTETRLVG
jgi:hypothetical protein